MEGAGEVSPFLSLLTSLSVSQGGHWLNRCSAFVFSSRLAAESLCDMMGLKSIETVNVKHRVRAYGIVMTHRDGWRIV